MTTWKPFVAAAGAMFLLTGSPDDARAQERPDLTGTWTLNLEESDDPREMMQDGGNAGGAGAQSGRRGAGGRGGAGGAGGGFGGRGSGGGGGGRGGGGGIDRDRMQQTMELMRNASRTFTVTQNDSMVTFTYGDGTVLALHTDGRKLKQTVEGRGDIEIKARWKKRDFIVERKVSRGGKLWETFLRPEDRDQLYVIVRVELGPGRQAREFRRVYDLSSK